jgi:L-alanine-DL-glutamate epimerase-like enolase superfamily enzyme
MIFETIEPIALRIPNRTGALHFVFRRVRTRDGVEGFGECLCGRPAMQRALMAMVEPAYFATIEVEAAMGLLRDRTPAFAVV